MDNHQEILELTINQTVINTNALIWVLLSGMLILFLPRRMVVLPFLITAIFIPIQQRIVISGIDLIMIRILIIFGFTRIIIKSEYFGFKLNFIDKIILLWALFRVITYTLLWKDTGSFVYKAGSTFDALGIYFLFRLWIQDFEEINWIVKSYVFICFPIAIVMTYEHITAHNLFSVFGGVPEITMIREGKLRCQGSFAHPILAGTFGAALFPIIISLYRKNFKDKLLMVIGIISSIIIVLNSNSSGPIITLFAGIIGLFFWKFRFKMKTIYLSVFFILLILHMVMQSPVWFLIGRATVIGSSTGYHRSMLIDAFIRNFKEWFLFGTQSTAHWGHYGLNLWDVTNQFVRVGVDGGFLTLFLFCLIVFFCFRVIGDSLKYFSFDYKESFLIWTLGVSLFAHLVSFMGVAYFDQIIVLWYSTLAMISALKYINFTDFHYKS